MKIAIIDTDNLRNPFWAAGQARATYEVATILAKKNKVTVYSSKYPGYKDYKMKGITYKHVGVAINNRYITNIVFVLNIPFLVRKIKNFDLIIENFNAPASVSFAPLFTKIPVIALPTMFRADKFSQKYHLPFHWIERVGIKFYKYMLPYSDDDSSRAKSYNSKLVYKIVPQGVSKEYLKIKQKKPKHILFLGRFDIDQKGIDLLLKSYAKISSKIDYPLIIAGHGPDEEKIKKLIIQLKLEDKVKIVGAAYGEKKIKLMSEALYVAFPSRHDEMCLWALEALAAGLPLIGFDLPESKWMKKDFSLKAKCFSVNSYASILLKATSPELINKMRKESRAFAGKYTWENVANQYESFYETVLDMERQKKQLFVNPVFGLLKIK